MNFRFSEDGIVSRLLKRRDKNSINGANQRMSGSKGTISFAWFSELKSNQFVTG
jgi:hypothetical protein